MSLKSELFDSSVLFDVKTILRNTPDKDKLSVTIKKDKIKGASLFATKPIKDGDIIAHYKMKIFTEPKNDESYLSTLIYKKKVYHVPYGKMYNFTVSSKLGYVYKTLCGDLYEGSLSPPKKNIPYWAYFSNEPSPSQKSNSEIVSDNVDNFKNKTTLTEGDTIIYTLVATADIKKGDEILWCYGEGYVANRNYATGCGY